MPLLLTVHECDSMLFHRWYIDGGVVALMFHVCFQSYITWDLLTSISPSVKYLVSMTSVFSSPEMKKSNVPHFNTLSNFLFCAKYVAQKRTDASKLLQQLAQVGLMEPRLYYVNVGVFAGWPELSHLL